MGQEFRTGHSGDGSSLLYEILDPGWLNDSNNLKAHSFPYKSSWNCRLKHPYVCSIVYYWTKYIPLTLEWASILEILKGHVTYLLTNLHILCKHWYILLMECYSFYSIFTSFLTYVLFLFQDPTLKLVSLGSSWLRQFLRLSQTLTVWSSTGQVFCLMFFSWLNWDYTFLGALSF